MKVKNFTHLHLASGYSFKYGTALPDQLVTRAGQLGMNSLALTDRDGLAGAIRFAQSCEREGISPILGIDLSFIQKKYRIILLAQTGKLPALYRLVTAINSSNNENLLTYETLEKFSEYSSQLLILHGARSQLASVIAKRGNEEALSMYNSTRELFAAQALECTSHQIGGDGPFSTSFAAKMLGFARDHSLPAIISNAVRMLDRADGPIADVLDAARLLVPLHQRHVERSNSEAFLKSGEEMRIVADEIARLSGERNANTLLATTREWSERALLSPRRDIGIGGILLPEPSVVGAGNYDELAAQLRSRSHDGLRRYSHSSRSLFNSASVRLEEELATIRTLGFESYFLTVADITDMARARGIRVAARGSGAGSLICYLLGISGVEPLSQDLLMERFCSTLRGELPDIDIDVESHRRLEIYNAVFERYGNTRTATVAMVDRYRDRQAIRDVCAALGITYMEAKDFKADTPIMRMAVQLAKRLYGLPRHLSMHPCAVVLSNARLLNVAPTQMNASNYPMVQFDKDDVEAIGLLKLDILGVRMQSAISYSLQEIKRVEGKLVDIDEIALDDRATFDLIKSTRTLGIFQVESPGQRELVGKLAPSTFTDLIIDISLFRPGPVKSDMITPFINTRHGLRPRIVIHPNLEEILRETEGVVVFHEQVIRIISIMTGTSLAEADEKRRQLGSAESQQEVCDWFYPASLANGYEMRVVTEVWEVLRAFASFGFCKAHAAAFALPTYQSAWLKTHHTAAFIAGALTHDPGMYPKRLLLDEARQWGIEIAPIDINRSDRTYRVERNKNVDSRAPYLAPNLPSTGEHLFLPDARGYSIRIALSDIQGINDGEIERIILGRPYLDLSDFVYRSSASRPTAEALVLVGAFDDLHELNSTGLNRRDLLLHLQDLYKLSGHKKGSNKQMTLGLLPPALEVSGLPDLTSSERVRHEVDLTGMDISHHMMEFYGEFLNHIGAIRSSDLIHQRSGASVFVAGVKVALQTPPIRSGRRVMFLSLDDGYGCNDLTFFQDVQESCEGLIREHQLFLVQGNIRRTGPRGISLRATSAWELGESYEKWRNLPVYERADG